MGLKLLAKISACRGLYVEHGGLDHDAVERGMRELGYAGFTKRSLYARTKHGVRTAGWPERFGWDGELPVEAAKAVKRSRPGTAYASRRTYAREHTPLHSAAFEAPRPMSNRQKARRLRRQAERRNANAISTPPKAPLAVNAGARAAGPAAVIRAPERSPAGPDFQTWLKTLPGVWSWDLEHQVQIYEQLKRLTDGDCRRLMIFMPPRHGKSELVTVRYSAWRLQRDPSMRIIVGSYNQNLADNFSRKIRTVLCEHEANRRSDTPDRTDAASAAGRSVTARPHPGGVTGDADRSVRAPESPFPFARPRPANRVSEWETTKGGGLKAVGVGSGVTGYGADLIVIDDPVKSREQAESRRFRDKVWNWFNDDLYTRLEPDGAVILIQTRWHEDDLAGRLLEDENHGGRKWDVIDLPAIAEEEKMSPAETQGRKGEEGERQRVEGGVMSGGDTASANVNIGPSAVLDPRSSDPEGHVLDIRTSQMELRGSPAPRLPGTALWPERYGVAALAEIERRIGASSFAALYQQRPSPAEGGLFKRAWFTEVVRAAPPGLKWARGYDLAVSTRTTADYTASFRCAFDGEGNLYIADGFRMRIEAPEQRQYIIGRILAETDTEHGIESAVHALAMIQDLRRNHRLRGRRFRKVKVDGDKVARASAWSPLGAEGRIRLVRGPWNDAFVAEAAAFPNGSHDDQIDAVSVAVQMLRAPLAKLITFNESTFTLRRTRF